MKKSPNCLREPDSSDSFLDLQEEYSGRMEIIVVGR